MAQGSFELGRTSAPIAAGDRVFLCTDGVLEVENQAGRPVGVRGVVKLLQASAEMPLDEVPAHLLGHLNKTLAGRPQDDDITFIAAEIDASAPNPAANTPEG